MEQAGYFRQKMLNCYSSPLHHRQEKQWQLTEQLANRNGHLHDYSTLQAKYSGLQDQTMLLENQMAREADVRRHEAMQAQHLAHQLRQIHQEQTNKVRNLRIHLNDLLGEADSLASLKERRQEEISILNDQVQDLRDQAANLSSDRGMLLQQQNQVQKQQKEQQTRFAQLQRNLQAYGNKIQQIKNVINQLQLASERIDKQVGHYQEDNKRLDEDVAEISRRELLLQEEVAQQDQHIKNLQFSVAELQADRQGWQLSIQQTRKGLQEEKNKAKDYEEALKRREQALTRLKKMIEKEYEECDSLVNENGRVAQINGMLKNDRDLCQKHKVALIRNNDTLITEINNFKKQDHGVLAQIQLRSETPTRQVTTPMKNTQAKFNETKATLAGSRLRSSRQAENTAP